MNPLSHSPGASSSVHNGAPPAWVASLPLTDVSRWNAAVHIFRSITSEDKVAVLYDDDGDGVSSGAIAAWGVTRLRGRAPDMLAPFGHGSGNANEALLHSLREAGITKLITLDRSLEQAGESFTHSLESFCSTLIVDHHKVYAPYSSDSFILFKPNIVWETESSSFPTAILAYTLFSAVTDMSDKDWVACIGIVSDSAYPRWKTFVDASAEKWGLPPVKEDPFEAPFGIMSKIIYCTQILSSYQLPELLDSIVSARAPQELLASGFRSLVSVVDEEVDAWMHRLEAEIEWHPELELGLGIVQPRYSVKSLLINKFSRRHPEKSIILLQETSDGSRMTISARRQDHRVAMNDLLEFAIQGLPDARAGGHAPASGGIFLVKDKDAFVERLKSYLRAHYSTKKKE